MLTIRDVRAILTMPDGYNRLVVVKVETSEPGLYGLGCATYAQRPFAVQTAVERYLKPFLVGKDAHRIEDLWHTMMVNPYWRNGPVLNNAISGVDMALWDIKGKVAGLPVYQLLGGKCREAAVVYRHVGGRTEEEVAEQIQAFLDEGYRYLRCHWSDGGLQNLPPAPEGALPGVYFDPVAYARSAPSLFAFIRGRFGDKVELLHDIHEHLTPIQAINLVKRLEPFDLFFLEDPLSPEQGEWLRILRQQCSVPIALGELFNHPQEWMPLIRERLIDFIRVHLSQIGGITPARKLATLCETFGIRTAWHGPGDVSPVGHAANLHLDLSSPNFGIQEWAGFSEAAREVFPGCPQARSGYLYPNDRPGLGIDLDEQQAARYPCTDDPVTWTLLRTPDGTAVWP
jgi:mannonate dehydratase